MKVGEQITIIPSLALKELRIEKLAGITALIVEVVRSHGVIKGCWVLLPGRYLGEREWYIPYNSIGLWN